MGWLNSVGIMQEISENLLRAGALNPRNRVSRDRALPLWFNEILVRANNEDRAWWHIYLDNFAAAERIFPDEQTTAGKLCHEAAESAWGSAGVVSSAKKRVSASTCIAELGAEVDGINHSLGVSTHKLLGIAISTLWLLQQRFVNRKHLQIIVGRWVFVLQFRRPAMSVLRHTWSMISGSVAFNSKLRNLVKGELWSLLSLCCTLHCNLRAPVSEDMIVTDASTTGGAVGFAEGLSVEGKDFVRGVKVQEASSDGVLPILLVSCFNGIGGCFRSYDAAGIMPRGRIAIDLDDAGNRITMRRWPGTILVKDVRDINHQVASEWSRLFLEVEEIHLWAGWPCVDLSAVKYNRLNLDGPQSSLFWEVPRIISVLREAFGSGVIIKFVLENVASMDREVADSISETVGVVPYMVDPVHAAPMKRPRLVWTSEVLESLFVDVEIIPRRHWKEVVAAAPFPLVNQWLTPGHFWPGADVATFPTAMKSIPRLVPPPAPAGYSKCSEATLARWRSDSYRYPPYQYGPQFVITSPQGWRLLSVDEKELLLGYGFEHTAPAWSASAIKQQPQAYIDKRHSLLGDSFSIFSFVMFAVACCRNRVQGFTYKQLAGRLGVAPGFRLPRSVSAPLARRLVYGSTIIPDQLSCSELNRILLRRTNHTGSDVRVITGEVFNSKIFPRQSICSAWWRWKQVFARRWLHKGHINVLELETILLGLKYQITKCKCVDMRIFQVTDSYVSMSVISKGRSSSKQLQRVLNTISAYLLAFGLQMVVAHVDSTENFADEGSRN